MRKNRHVWLIVCCLGVVGVTLAAPPTEVIPPRPHGSNPEFLMFADEPDLEGTLRVLFDIAANGGVTNWEILECPETTDKVRGQIEARLHKWRFEPAQRIDGKAVESTYELVRYFSPNIAYELARVYSLPSADVGKAFERVAKERGLKISRKDRGRGIYISKWFPMINGLFEGLEIHESIEPLRVRFHVFIPQGFEPARVYINTELDARLKAADTTMLYYNSGGFESWLFGVLEKRLEQQGRPLPRKPLKRWELFESMLPGSTGTCGQEQILLSGLSGIKNPQLVTMSKMTPIYPPTGRTESAQVIVQAVIYEDGAVGDTTVIRASTRNVDFATSAKQTISFWRYDPSRQRDCSVSVYFTVVVDYSM